MSSGAVEQGQAEECTAVVASPSDVFRVEDGRLAALDQPVPLAETARRMLDEGKADEAAELARVALGLHPEDRRVHSLLAAAEFRAENYDVAVGLYRELVEQAPETAAFHVNLGLSLLKAGRASEAVEELELATDRHPESRKAWACLAVARQRNSDRRGALEAYERAGIRTRQDEEAPRRTRPLPDGQDRPSTSRSSSGLTPPKTGFEHRGDDDHTERPVAADLSIPGGEARLAFPSGSVGIDQRTGMALARVQTRGPTAGSGFAARSRLLAFVAGRMTTSTLQRQVDGPPLGEPFGGPLQPFARIEGSGRVALQPPRDGVLLPAVVSGRACFLEHAIAAFELSLTFENRKLAGDETQDSTYFVEFTGSGTVILQLAGEVVGVDASIQESVAVDVSRLLGWTGQLAEQMLDRDDAFSERDGMVRFFGSGTLYLRA